MKPQRNPLLDDHLTVEKEEKVVYSNYWFISFFCATLLLGLAASYYRPYFYNKGIHWEAIISLIILAVMNAAWLYFMITTRKENYIRVYIANTGLLWLGFYFGWIVINNKNSDIMAVCGAGACVGWIVGLLVFSIQKRQL